MSRVFRGYSCPRQTASIFDNSRHTERKEIEREVVKRTNDLARSNLELQQFAYVASHDLQEPLRMVTAYLSLLEKKYGDQLDGKAKEYMDIAIDGGIRARSLIQDLLEFSRVGAKTKEFQPTNMEEVLSKSIENLSIRIREEKALITHDHLPTILADDFQMLQVMQNLIGNAIKFHGTEPPVVHISYKDNGREWCFSVSDNGIGIDPQYKHKIFVLFQRLHNRNDYEGLELALLYARRSSNCMAVGYGSIPARGAEQPFISPSPKHYDHGREKARDPDRRRQSR